jgi:hypothetical protein
MRAMFIRGANPKDAMGIGDPKARLAQSLKKLSEEIEYEFRYINVEYSTNGRAS